MGSQWHVPSVQETGQAVNTIVTADDDAGTVLVGTAGRSLTHLAPSDARALADALTEAAQRVDPESHDDETTDLVEALRAFIARETDR